MMVVEEMASTVISEAKPKTNDAHPTMKPVALFERQLLNSSMPGDAVLDSKLGVGTTVYLTLPRDRVIDFGLAIEPPRPASVAA